MGDVVATTGQALAVAGLAMAIIIQVYVFIRIIKTSAVSAVLALLVYGYVLYYIWRSDHRMPRVFRAYVSSVALFVVGMIVVSVGVEM